MSSAVIVIAGVAIIAWTVGSQLMGTAIRAKRLIILPGIIAVVGVVNLSGASVHPSGADVGLIALGSAIAAATGTALGALMRLERRDGWLWGQLPKRGLWLWVVFFASRGVLVGAAHALGAHVAGGTHAELLILGINRLGQALVVGARAVRSHIPFAPESNGARPLAGLFGPASSDATSPPSEATTDSGDERYEPSAGANPAPGSRLRLLDQLRATAPSDAVAAGPRARRRARRARRRGR